MKRKVDPFVGILIVMTFVVGFVLILTVIGGETIRIQQWFIVVFVGACWGIRFGIPFVVRKLIKRKNKVGDTKKLSGARNR